MTGGPKRSQTNIREAASNLDPELAGESNAPGDVLDSLQESPGPRADLGNVGEEIVDSRAALSDRVTHFEAGAPPGLEAPTIPARIVPAIDLNRLGGLAKPTRDATSVDNLPFGRRLQSPSEILRGLGGGSQLKPRGLSVAEDGPTTDGSGATPAGGADSTSPEKSVLDHVWDWIKGVFAPTPPFIPEGLASEEGAAAEQGGFNALQEMDARSEVGDEAGNEEYYRRRGQSTAGFWKSKMGDGKEKDEEKKEEEEIERPTDDAPVTGPVADRLNVVPVPGPKFRTPAGGPDPVGPEGGDDTGGPDPFGSGYTVLPKPGFFDPVEDPSAGGAGLVEASGRGPDRGRGPDFVNPRWVDTTELGDLQTELGTHNPGAEPSLVEGSGDQQASPPPAAPSKRGLRAGRVVAAAVLAIGLIVAVSAIVSRDVGGREDVPTGVSEIGREEGTSESDSFLGEGGSTGVSGRDASDAGHSGPASDAHSEGTGGLDDGNVAGSTGGSRPSGGSDGRSTSSSGTSASDGQAQTQPDPNQGQPFENDGPTTPDEGTGGQPDPNQGQPFENNGPTTPDGGSADPIPELN